MDENDRMALDEISLPLYEEPAPRRRRHIMSTTANNNLTHLELDVARSLGISAEKFAAQKVAQHARENDADPGEDATNIVFRAFGIKQDELPQARMTREGASGAKQLSEKLGDLIHHIGLASQIHLRHNDNPSISLMCAAQIASDLQTQLNGANGGDDSTDDSAEGGLPMLNRVSSHARMPGAHKVR
jgi:hypothetical protein